MGCNGCWLKNFYISIAVSIEVVMHWRKLARLIKWCEIYLISDTCNIPISCLCRVPAVAFIISYSIYKHTTFVYGFLILHRNTLVHSPTKEEYNGMFMFKKESEQFLFEWRVEAADDNRICFTNIFCPGNNSAFGFRCDRTRSEEGYKMSLQQISISERAHKKA